MLSIDLLSADCLFVANKEAKSEQIAHYFADLASLYEKKGFEKVVIFLDRNPTHKRKMQTIFTDLTTQLTIQTEFRFIAAYSPKLNLVEYAIHLIRQKILHHADSRTCLAEFEASIRELCKDQKLLNKEQIINILEHIESLVPDF